jgi:hypothetical protein
MDQITAAAEWINDALDELREARDKSGPGPNGREIAIAITHIEDGQFRIQKLLSKGSGLVFPGQLADEEHAGETEKPEA